MTDNVFLLHAINVVNLQASTAGQDEYGAEASSAAEQDNGLDGYGAESLVERNNVKRKAELTAESQQPSLKQRYNNWFNKANDWSRRIESVQGRIRFKKQY